MDKLATKVGTVLVIVDQPASTGAPPLAVARDAGCKVAYLPGLSMRRIADLYPGEAKTDAKDATVIADAARTMPHTLRSVQLRTLRTWLGGDGPGGAGHLVSAGGAGDAHGTPAAGEYEEALWGNGPE